VDELSEKLNKVLSDPQSMNMISSLLGSLKNDGGNQQEESGHKNDEGGGLPDGSLELMMKMAPLLSSLNNEDDGTRLLAALRPYLRDERKKRLDEAKKILMLIKALPYIKEAGIL